MRNTRISKCHHHGWLDSLAISMSVICAIHCLLTPLLLVLLPVLTTTFWVHKDFHLWMICLVIPTTSIAVFLGCKQHKDKIVLFLSTLGLLLLLSVALYEAFFHYTLLPVAHAHCPQCLQREFGNIPNVSILINIFGGILLASAHLRNFILCRKADCHHE